MVEFRAHHLVQACRLRRGGGTSCDANQESRERELDSWVAAFLSEHRFRPPLLVEPFDIDDMLDTIRPAVNSAVLGGR
jgi:hypothetical protein